MSIQRNKRGRFEVRWLEDGRHRSRSFADESAAETFEEAVKEGHAAEVLKGRRPVAQYGMEWFDRYVLVDLSRNSQIGYAAIWDRYIAPDPISRVAVADLSARHIRDLRNRVRARVKAELEAENRRRVEAGLPPLRGREKAGLPTVRKLLAVLSSMIGFAMEEDVYPHATNPVHLVNARTGIKRKISASTNGRWYGTPLSIEQVERIIWTVIGRRKRARFLMRDLVILELLALGLRPEEIYGLDVCDVEELTIRVRCALARGEIEPVKSLPGIRRVQAEPTRLRVIRAYVERRVADGARRSDPLIVTQEGERMTESSIRNWVRRVFSPAVRELGLVDAVPYLLRHSRAAHLLQAGEANVDCAGQLGHSLATFMRVYAAVIRDTERRSVASLEEEVARARKAVRGEAGAG